MAEARTPAEIAAQIAAARDRLLVFAAACTDEVWNATPLAAQGDHRTVGIIVDHIAHAYDYMGGWMREILAGGTPQVDVALVDRLNAAHAARAGQLTQAGAMEHLTSSGDELIGLVTGLTEPDLEAGAGRVRRFAEIAMRHPDTHRADLEAALTAAGARR
jgi:DinB superfamily